MFKIINFNKNSSKNFKSGFTLIELLVVVAIIGILASVTVALLGNAKKKGEDKAITRNLYTIINQAEIFLTDNGNKYLPTGGATFSIATCPTYNASGTNMLSRDKTIATAIAEAVKIGSGSSCYNSASAWAVAVGLKESANTSWCVDSTGISKQVPVPPSSAITASFGCNVLGIVLIDL
ncbi:MAG: type II secretion system protein [Minisyncoccia bacterium]